MSVAVREARVGQQRARSASECEHDGAPSAVTSWVTSSPSALEHARPTARAGHGDVDERRRAGAAAGGDEEEQASGEKEERRMGSSHASAARASAS